MEYRLASQYPRRGRRRVLTAQGQDRRQKLSPKLPSFGRPARPRNRSEIPKEDLGKPLASAGRGQRARLRRGRNFVESSIPHGNTESINGARVCQPGLTAVNFFANGRKRLTEQIVPSPLAWVFGSGIIHPETNAPHWVQRAGVGQPSIASAQGGDVSWRGSA